MYATASPNFCHRCARLLRPIRHFIPSSTILGMEEYSNISTSLEIIDEDEVVELEYDGIKIENNGDDEIFMGNRTYVKEKTQESKVEMVFDNIYELIQDYGEYGKQSGFRVIKRSSEK
ncbi:hypothetical protein GBA52_008576 [Prunus armeniaca]|nr:hypothetical protein GBA52_008576 [Prunus armeniaca]